MPATSSPATSQAFKARAVIIAQLKRRGFDVTDYENCSVAEVHAMLQARQMDMLLSHPDGGKIWIKYAAGKALRPNELYDWIEDLYHLEQALKPDDELYVVARDPPNESIRKLLRDIWAKDGMFITVVGIAHLQFDVMAHNLVPNHERMKKDQSEQVARQYSIDQPDQVPDISRFSAVSAAIGLRPGEWCKITRPSPTAVSSDFYRICSR